MTTPRGALAALVTAVACVAALVVLARPDIPAPAYVLTAAPTEPPARICGNVAPGPTAAPAGAVVVNPVDWELGLKTNNSPAGTTFWLAPGVHTLGMEEYGQVIPKDGNTYIGAPGAVLDGRGANRSAFTQHATGVTIKHLEVRGFNAHRDQGVINHDSGDDWAIEHNFIHDNKGAALMAGARQQVRHNCLKDNGQYAMNAYQFGPGPVDVVVEHNEIVGNNTDNWEVQVPGCGCTGGIKFWDVDGADIRDNWVHHNRGPGLWADTNNNDFLIERNLIEANEGQAIFYEISYNAIIRDNLIRDNTWVGGKGFADRGDNFPIGTIYLSEAGGDPRVPARTDKVEIHDNQFVNNWGGVVAWENADRFCNSPANTSGGCTLTATQAQCVQPGIASPPLYDDCRWKTRRLDIHHNTFSVDPALLPGCSPPVNWCARHATISQFGTYPDWSPYKGFAVADAITLHQDNRWHDNTYTGGPWRFMVHDTGTPLLTYDQWRATPYNQDATGAQPPPTTTTPPPTTTTAPPPTTTTTVPPPTTTTTAPPTTTTPPPPPANAVEDAIRGDAGLSPTEKDVLIAFYRLFLVANP